MAGVRLGDVELHVQERGSGPELLLIAGIPAIADDWAPLAERLAERRRVIAYDNRGSGRSTVTPGPYSTRGLAADAVALLDALDVADADVLGISMGGMIAQEVELNWPGRVRRLVLGCTHAGMRHAVQPEREVGRAFALQTDDWALRIRTLAPFAFARDADPALVEAFVAKKSGDVQDAAGYAAQLDAVRHHSAYHRLDEIRAPTLVITGDDDRVIPAENSRVLAERITGAELCVIPGAGHLFFLEDPEATEQALEAFLPTPSEQGR